MKANCKLFRKMIVGLFFICSSLIGGESNDAASDEPSKVDEKKESNEKTDSPCKNDESKDDETKKSKDTCVNDKAKKEDDAEGDSEGDSKKEKKEEPPKIGNFALPESQQPSALFGFGGNIIDAGEVQIYFFADGLIGRKRVVTDMIPSVLFGITDNLSIFFNFPFSPVMRDCRERSSGLEDFFIQLEYAFYNKSTPTYTDEATFVANITVPTGSINVNPPTGFGSPSLFLGGTYYHVLVDWFVFTAQGALLTQEERRIKIGDQFLYQFGFGKNIESPIDWIYAWMIEVDGQYFKRNWIKGVFDRDSGGNIIFVTPSLWVSSKDMLLQFGVSFPIYQKWFGCQRKFDYVLNFNFAWSFY